MIDDDDPKLQAFLREVEKTFWLRFFIRSVIAGVGGFLATLIILPFLTTIYSGTYGYFSRPPAPVTVIRQAITNGCMEGKPAKVVNKSYEDHLFSDVESVITFQRGNNPTFICKFKDNLLLYKSWEINEIAYHAGGERL